MTRPSFHIQRHQPQPTFERFALQTSDTKLKQAETVRDVLPAWSDFFEDCVLWRNMAPWQKSLLLLNTTLGNVLRPISDSALAASALNAGTTRGAPDSEPPRKLPADVPAGPRAFNFALQSPPLTEVLQTGALQEPPVSHPSSPRMHRRTSFQEAQSSNGKSMPGATATSPSNIVSNCQPHAHLALRALVCGLGPATRTDESGVASTDCHDGSSARRLFSAKVGAECR